MNGGKLNAIMKPLSILSAAFCFLFLSAFARSSFPAYAESEAAESDCPVIETLHGAVQGICAENGVFEYLGIPYAKAPVGNLRFKAPQECDDWEGILEAAKKAPDPVQAGVSDHPERFSEDCLYLNVYVPGNAGENLPVLIFVPGGSYDSGGSSSYRFEDLTKRTDSIIVSLSYRLNVFGFLNFGGLSENFDDNLGLKDVIAALSWVRNNIAAFGGNPDNVTLSGESAGAGMVTCMMMNAEASEYFDKAFVMSSPYESFYSPERMNELRDSYLEGMGIAPEEVDRLLELDAAELFAGIDSIQGFSTEIGTTLFRPTADGDVISSPALKADLSGFGKPVLIGTTRDEATLFLLAMKDSELLSIINSRISILPSATKEEQDQLFRSYKGFPSKDAAAEIITDLVFAVGAVRYADMLSASSDVYFYRYDTCPVNFMVYGLKACHASDIMMLADIVPQNRGSRNFAAYIRNFLHTGSPNGKGLPKWPVYDTESRNTMLIDLFCRSQENPHRDALARYADLDDLLVKND